MPTLSDSAQKQIDQIETKSTPVPKSGSSTPSQIPDALNFDQFSNVDDVLKSFMDQDPQLKQHWEQLAESCNKAGSLLIASFDTR